MKIRAPAFNIEFNRNKVGMAVFIHCLAELGIADLNNYIMSLQYTNGF